MHFVTLRVTSLRRRLKIGRRASRTACDAERRTIVEKRFRLAMAPDNAECDVR
ncbi:DUF1534 domain-containing protein [Pseudomonas syringae pv. actinidiae]|nr:DUF1534 domain-containing protein [Pseudomonas syringae pv. actinidiae]